MPKPSNRSRVLASGLGLIHERGFTATSVRDVVRAAGVPQGSFTNHFATKEAFGLAVINEHYANTVEMLDRTLRNENLPPLKRIEAYFDATIDRQRVGAVPKGCLFNIFGIESSPHSEVIRRRIEEIFRELEKAIELCLDAAARTEALPDCDVGDMAALIMSAHQGAALRARAQQNPAPIEAAKRAVFAMILVNFRNHLTHLPTA